MDKYKSIIDVVRERRVAMPRYACSIGARIALDGHETVCRVTNISEGGLGLTVDAVVRLRTGDRVLVSAGQLGTLGCTVRWVAANQAGLEFGSSGRNSPHVKALLVEFERKRIEGQQPNKG